VAVGDLFPHRRLLSTTLNATLWPSTIRRSAVGSSSSSPCSLPRSSTEYCSCTHAAFEPSRRNFPSDSRGIVTGNSAWSDRSATGKIACFPSSLVCTSPHPPRRSSVFKLRPPAAPPAFRRPPFFRSCVGAQKLAILDRRARRKLRFGCGRIAHVNGPVAPHRMHDHRQFARHGDRRLVTAAPLREALPPALDLVVAFESRQRRADAAS
jgi:hypothetical protein